MVNMEIGCLYLYQGTMTTHRNHRCAMQEAVISNLWTLPANLGIFLKTMTVCCGQKFPHKHTVSKTFPFPRGNFHFKQWRYQRAKLPWNKGHLGKSVPWEDGLNSPHHRLEPGQISIFMSNICMKSFKAFSVRWEDCWKCQEQILSPKKG